MKAVDEYGELANWNQLLRQSSFWHTSVNFQRLIKTTTLLQEVKIAHKRVMQYNAIIESTGLSTDLQTSHC